jgi:hypothetical protein
MYGLTGKYRLDARLGGGGMAEVFIGSTVGAEGFSRKVAIKRILPGFSENPAFAQMFIAEAQITSRLQHPNIVSVLDFDRDADGRLFLVMELVEGKDLDDLAATGPLPIPVVIHVIGEVLRGLGYAHNLPASDGPMRGLIHRDVSPHNVLVSWEGAVKVSDFGIAKARAASSATGSVFIKGKPQYMSPEQANGQPLDGRSDLFAVGVMLWEMLTGSRLFVGNTTQEVLARMLFSPIQWPRQVRPEVPIDVERIAMRLLERNLLARYATAEDVIADLRACNDAPRGGSDELVAVMAERFPDLAPARPGRRSAAPVAEYQGGATTAYAGGAPLPSKYATPTATTARSGTPNAVPILAHAPVRATAAAAPTVQQPAAPAVHTPAPSGVEGPVAAMAAETRTLGEAPRRTRIPLAVWIVAGAVIALLVTLILATGWTKGKPGDSPAGGSAGIATLAMDASATPDATPPDAAPVAPAVPDAAPARPDAKPARRPRPDAKTATARPADDCTFDRDGDATGTVAITVEPWAYVTIDGVRQPGQTPPTIRKRLQVGCHVIKLENPDADRSERRKVKIEAGRTATVNADWN